MESARTPFYEVAVKTLMFIYGTIIVDEPEPVIACAKVAKFFVSTEGESFPPGCNDLKDQINYIMSVRAGLDIPTERWQQGQQTPMQPIGRRGPLTPPTADSI
jgi:hypothetical protein